MVLLIWGMAFVILVDGSLRMLLTIFRSTLSKISCLIAVL